MNDDELKKASEEATYDAARAQTCMSMHASVDASAALAPEELWIRELASNNITAMMRYTVDALNRRPLEYGDGYLRQDGDIVASEVAQSLGRMMVHRFNLHEELVNALQGIIGKRPESHDEWPALEVAAAHVVLKRATTEYLRP